MTQLPNASTLQPVAFVGIDWADQQHAVCIRPADTLLPEHSVLKHTPEAIVEFVAMLRTRFGGQPVAVGLEQARGALLYALMSYEFLLLYPINPATAKRFRDAFAPSGAKDDPVDAGLICELLVKHREKLRPWSPQDPNTRQLALLCEHRRDLVNQATRFVQQMRAALKAYFPQALELTGDDLATVMATDFLIRWPTLESLQKSKAQTVRAFYYAHRCRRLDRIEQRLGRIKTATALTSDHAVIAAHSLRVESLARQLRVLLAAIAEYDRQIAALFATHPDATLFKSLPGAARCMAPRLAAAFGIDRERFPEANAMAKLCGGGASHTTQWQVSDRPSTPRLPKVSAANLSRIRRLFNQAL